MQDSGAAILFVGAEIDASMTFPENRWAKYRGPLPACDKLRQSSLKISIVHKSDIFETNDSGIRATFLSW
jgi:hypothetical protein